MFIPFAISMIILGLIIAVDGIQLLMQDHYNFDDVIIFRVNVNCPFEPVWIDHVALRIMFEKDAAPGAPWFETILSPARARMLAYQLLEMAEHVEAGY